MSFLAFFLTPSVFSPNQGSIANFKEENFSFPDRLPLQLSQSELSVTSSHIESVRTTGGQSDSVDLAELSSPSLTKSHQNLSSDEPQTGAVVLPLPLPKNVGESSLLNNNTSVEESDEDNDELDLIGSSAFSTEGERRQLYTTFEQEMPLQVSRYPVSDIAQEAAIEDTRWTAKKNWHQKALV